MCENDFFSKSITSCMTDDLFIFITYVNASAVARYHLYIFPRTVLSDEAAVCWLSLLVCNAMYPLSILEL